MVVERQLDNYNPSDLNIQSALAVTLKDKVKISYLKISLSYCDGLERNNYFFTFY
jgi:hypothetical protein